MSRPQAQARASLWMAYVLGAHVPVRVPHAALSRLRLSIYLSVCLSLYVCGWVRVRI
jgi:hypothetical protein